jgi:hypothetical protein
VLRKLRLARQVHVTKLVTEFAANLSPEHAPPVQAVLPSH